MSKKVSIIIPNFNGLKFLKKAINSLEKQTYTNFELIVVDNGSIDGSKDFLQGIANSHSNYKAIFNKTNLGFAKAVNQGIDLSSSEYICLLNNDVEVDSNFIQSLIRCLDYDKNIFSVSSKMIQYDNRDLIDDAGDDYNILAWTKKIGLGKPANKFNQPYEIFSSCAGAAMYRKSILNEIGLFDEIFFAYLEDVDISYRAKIHGYKNIYCPEAMVYHVGSGSSGSKYNEFKTRLSPRNNIWVVYKNMPWPQILFNILFLILGFFIKYLFFLKKGLGSIYLESLKEGILHRKKVKKTKFKRKNIKNYLKIEFELIKNLFKFPF